MAKFYMDENGKVTVNKEENQEKKRPKYTIDEKGNVTVNTNTSADIAPVRTDVPGSADYERKAQEGLSAYHQKKTEAIEKEKSESGLWKFLKNMALAGLYANDNPIAMSFNQQAQVYRQDTSYKEINDRWNEDQKKRFGYLYQQSPASAAQYAESVNNEINKAKADAEREKIMQQAANRGIAGNTALALLQGVTASADLLDNMAEFAGRGTITQKDGLTLYERSQANIAGYSEKLNKLGTIKEDVPVLGGKGLGDLYSIGYSAAQSLLYGATGNGALIMTQFFAQAAASGIDETMERGGTAQQAMLYGMAAGAAEAVAEKIGIDNLFKNAGAKTWSAALKSMLQQGAAEGMEEALTSVLNTFSDQVIMGKESQYHRAVAEYSKTMTVEEAKRKALDDILQGITYDALGGMISGVGNTMVMTGARAAVNVSQGKGSLSGLTANEKKVVDQYHKALVAEEAKNSKNGKVSMDRKNELFEEAIKAMDEGSISIETIEEALGGENFQAYQDAVSNEKAWQEEYDQLNGMKEMEMTGVQKDRKTELRQKLDTYKNGNTQQVLKEKYQKSAEELARVSRLSESYRERDRRSQGFQADVSRYSGKAQQIVQKAIDSGILNNTRRSHQLVDLIAKVGSDKNLDFDFANNEKLKESGFALEGKIVNGVVTGSGVTVNINSAKALNTVVGHEITHVLEGSEFYDALSGAAIEMAKAKGEYDSRMKDIEALYTENLDGYGGEGRAAALEKELVADLVGDYLFTDSAFIDRLYAGNRNAFEKAFDEVKYFCRMATAGSKEAKQLEKVKKAFEDAYRQDAKNTADDGGVRYSIDSKFNERLDSWDGKTIGFSFVVGETSKALQEAGIPKKQIRWDASKISTLLKKHTGMNIDIIKQIPELLENPVVVVDSKKGDNSKIVMGDLYDENRKIVTVVLLLTPTSKKGNVLDLIKVSSAEGRGHIKSLFTYEDGSPVPIRYMDKKRIQSWLNVNRLQLPLHNHDLDSNDIIQDGEGTVNNKMSISLQEDMFPVRKDLRPGRIYGSDVELAPVRQDVQAQTETEERGEYDDLPFEMPEGIENGQLTDEELEEDAKRRPVETVTQRLEVKFASLRQELRENEQHRQVSNDAYERKIEELQQRYDAKPNKHTKAANAILRQISKQKQLQAQRDAEFEKRIHDIQKKIDNTRELIKWDHSREDLLEKQLRQVDEKLEADKQALEEEFRERRAEAEKLADKNGFISAEARKLYDEIINHKKGTRFSNEIGELLDKGHSFPQIKTALLLIEEKPEGRKNRSWVVEQDLREILGRNYENAAYEAGEIDNEYQKRLDELEAQAKEDRASYTTAAQRKNIQLQYEQMMEKLAGDTSKWKDKTLGVQYQINTLRRNLRDVVRDENGKPDFKRADAIWDALQGSYNHNEAELKRESNRIKGAYAALKLTKEENVYVQMLGEFRHNPETTLSLETVEGYLEEHKDKIDAEKVDKAIEMARKTYDELLVRVNEALRKQGMKEIPYRKGYFPHFTEEAKGRGRLFLEKVLNFKYKSDDIPTDIAGLTEGLNPNRSWQSFNKERTSDITEYNFAKGMDSYVHGALDWIYHMEDIQKRRAFENHIRYVHSDEGVQARIDEVKKNDLLDADQVQEEIDKILAEKKNPLNNLVNDLRTGTNILAGKKNSMDRGMEQRFSRKVYSIMTGLSSRINANMVAGSISSALTNFIPITQSWGEVSPLSTLQAMGETIRSYVRDDDVVNKSDFLTNRLRPEENLYKTGWDKVTDHVGWMMEAVDNFSAQTIWRSKYNENVSKGMSEAEAIKNADEFAEGVMAGRSRGNMPTAFDEKNPITRILTAFQLEVNNQYGYMFKDMPQNMQKETKARLVAGYAKMFLGAYAYNALFSQLTGRDSAFDPIRIVQELLGDLFPDDDEEEKKPSKIVGGFLEDVAQEMPFIGGLMGGGRIPLSSALPYGDASGPIEGVTNFIKDIEDGKKFTWEWLNPAFYLLTPVGGGQMRKSAMGLSMFLNDKPTPGSYTATGNLRFPVEPTMGNIAQAAVFGQWANKNARSYSEEGRTPIQANQIQDFLNSGLTYEGWWKQKDALKKAENDFNAQEPIAAFNEAQTQLEELAADALAGDQEILQEKFIQSAAKDLSEIKKEMMELVTMPLNEEAKTKQMQLLQEKANSIAKEAVNAYSNVEIENGYATVGEKVWKQGTDGEWKRLTGDQLAKYQVTIGAGAEGYATDGSNHYVESKDGWRKLTDDQVSKQRAVTGALGITAQDYWGEKHEEYDFAYENPEMYTVAKAVGGYDTYSQWKKAMGNIQGDQKNGKTVPGSKKEKIWDYIDQQKMTDGQKYLLFKSMYPADDTYNKEIVKYLNSRRDITFADKKKMLEKLGFTVNKDGTIDW